MAVNEQLRLGIGRAILSDPADPAPRLVWADHLEEFGNANETPELLRQEPGHWELFNFDLYWVLDEPYSEWTHNYIQQVMDSDRSERRHESPFKYVGSTHLFGEAKCAVCERTCGEGRFWTGLVRSLRRGGERKSKLNGWVCASCEKYTASINITEDSRTDFQSETVAAIIQSMFAEPRQTQA